MNPETFTDVLAILGVYAALMAVLAIIVEAVLSWLKLVPQLGLQGKPSPDDVFNEVKNWLPADKTKNMKGRIDAINKSIEEVGKTEIGMLNREDESITADDIAAKVGETFTKYVKDERRRRAWIRTLAIVLGTLFAWMFEFDTFRILSPLVKLDPGLLGIMLSGFAASAGSSFWHDQSARLRQLKTATESIGKIA